MIFFSVSAERLISIYLKVKAKKAKSKRLFSGLGVEMFRSLGDFDLT